MFVTDVDDEQGCGDPSQLGDTTQYFFLLILLAGERKAFLLGDAVESAVVQHFLYALHLLDALADSIEVGEHTTQPAFGDERHVYFGGALGDDLFSLFLGTDKHDLLSALGDLLHGRGRFLEALGGLVEVDDMDAFFLSKDIRQHFGVPLLTQVTEMYTGFKELLL